MYKEYDDIYKNDNGRNSETMKSFGEISGLIVIFGNRSSRGAVILNPHNILFILLYY